ncbi:hypothetical protein Tco_1049663, partial [Tanacetum coccineum]
MISAGAAMPHGDTSLASHHATWQPLHQPRKQEGPLADVAGQRVVPGIELETPHSKTQGFPLVPSELSIALIILCKQIGPVHIIIERSNKSLTDSFGPVQKVRK